MELPKLTEAQRRYQVFVSSTYLDLRQERQAVTATLLEADAIPTGMELFPATDEDAWTLIKKVIDECDYYLLVIAGKYGSVDDVTGLSYTEMEYDYAVSAKKPVMAFLHGDPGELTVAASETTEDARKKLATFRSKVKASKHVKHWTSSDQLAGQVALTYNKFVRLYPAVGWIRADRAASAETLQALSDARSRIDELEQQLGTLRTTAPAGAELLAQGEELTSVPVLTHAKYRKRNGQLASVSAWQHVDVTWDNLFATVAPRLLQECDEEELKKLISEYLELENYGPLAAKLVELAKDAGGSPKIEDLFDFSCTVDDDEFGTVLIQFMALGLIQRSERKRSVNDTGTYWTLTPYGETRAIQLRAVKSTRSSLLPQEGGAK
ncbi:DUF4062 domain-containing protein [Blastococcus sp. HT6-30]|uniref:DUF4062 domain-containing protein n=1 Tax=Blastococcus sp. HT6-30 TaxID=3144843 RepID=UPI00321B7832